MITLRCIAGSAKGHDFPFLGGELVLGRKADPGLKLEDAKASGRHCLLRAEGAEVYVEDLKSANGTYVNGARISRVRLEAGDRLVVGNHVFEVREVKA